MNLSEHLALLSNKLLNIDNIILEDKGHLDHPEDLVFLSGKQGAERALDAIDKTVKNPNGITIKWDGYPALIFGRGPNGKFSIMDKHMFNKKDGSGRQIYSPEQFVQYDRDRGVDRSGLHQIISTLWPGLSKSDSSKGYYWGDLLFGSPLTPINGKYKFRANPNGITYTVDEKSDIGNLFKNKTAGIVVHQFLQPTAPTTDAATPLNGTIGNLKNVSDVAILPAKMPVTPKLTINNNLVKKLAQSINLYGDSAEELMSTAPQSRNTFNQLFTTYINKKIISGSLENLLPDFMEYVKNRPMTNSMRQKIESHLQNNLQGLKGIFQIWADIYTLKMSLVDQLNKAAQSSPVQGYLEDGTQTQEGFVSQGLKFVDRMGFSRQNLAAKR